jgi:hypothetical protein
MKEIMFEKPFLDLPSLDLKETAPFSLYVHFYEEEMSKRNGRLELDSINKHTFVNLENYEDIITHYCQHGGDRGFEYLDNILEKFEDIETPSSMAVSDLQDLEKHVLTSYQFSYAHYVIAKKKGLKNFISYSKFPINCCGMSSRNIMLSLMENGYHNAAYGYNKKNDHGCVLLPFVMKDNQGIVVIDPTSDQLWDDSMPREYFLKKPKNHTFVVFGEIKDKRFTHFNDKWEYITDRKGDKDLVPDSIMNLETLREHKNQQIDNVKPCHSFRVLANYLEKAFSNPVEVNKKW